MYAIVGVVALHLIAVTIAALPTNAFSAAARPVTSYLSPYFTQNWRLFAPNPISADRTFWVRGAYENANGQTETTEWVNWSDVELDVITHHLVGGRAGYITKKMIGPLSDRYRALNQQQRQLVAQSAEALSLDALAEALSSRGDNPSAIDGFISYEKAATRLATAIMNAVHPDIEFTGVQYRIGRHPVTPYESRKREETRPARTYRVGGWREPLPADETEQAVFDRFWSQHR